MRRSADKRRHARVDGGGLRAHLKIDGELKPSIRVENLSLGGALLAAEPKIESGKNVLVELLRGNAPAIWLVGRVVATAAKGVRIRFNPLNAASTNELYELIDGLSLGAIAATPIETALPDFHSIEIPTEEVEL